jgi:hypothetical protein
MNTDIRLSIDFWDHPKTVKLERLLGLKGIKSLQILWLWVAQNRSTGRLRGLDVEDIEIAAKWDGEAGKLIEGLLSLRWLDKNGDGFALHDWSDHNSWAAEAEQRSEKALLSKLAQSNYSAFEELKRQGKQGITREEYRIWKKYNQQVEDDSHSERTANASETLAPAPSPSPSPSPSPTPNVNNVDSKESIVGETADDTPKAPPCPHQKIIDAYHETLPELPHISSWGKTNQKHLQSRWREKPERQDLEWWRKLFQYVREGPWLMGNNKTGWTASLGWMVLPTNMDKILNGNFHRTGNTLRDTYGEKGARTIENLAGWLKRKENEGH